MLGNDRYGDCVAVTWANERYLISSALTGHGTYPDLSQVISVYRTQNPGFPAEDNGMDIQTLLEYLVKTGGPDGVKAVAFAKVDHTKRAEVEAALAIFGCIWTGINVLEANMAEFDAGQPWDDVPGSPVDGGHSVISGGYSGQAASDVKFVTWAKETSFTDAFWSSLVEEAWVVIWPEHLGTTEFEAGIDLSQLAADYQDITGNVLPIPTPVPPTPTPTPTPVPPTPPPPGFIAEFEKIWHAFVKAVEALIASFK